MVERCADTNDLLADRQRDDEAVIGVLRGDGTVELDCVAGVPSVPGVGFVEKQVLLDPDLALVDPYTAHGVWRVLMYEPFPDQGKV